MFDLVTIGDAVSDLFIEPEEISLMCPMKKAKGKTCFEPVLCLEYGEKIPIKNVHYDIGGSACNMAVGLSRQGFNVGFIGAVGKDAKGNEILEKLEEEGVSTQLVKRMKEVKTSFSVIFNFKGERTILVYRGLSDYSLLAIPKNLGTKWLFVGPLGEKFEKLYNQIIPLVSTKNIHLALNPGSIQIKEGVRELMGILKITKALFLNKGEAEEICQTKGPTPVKDLLLELKKMGPKVVFITDGPEGAFAYDGNECLKISAYQAERKEATGAGDAFTSGVLGALLLHKDLKEALKMGVINASSVIEKIGAQNGLLNNKQIESKMSKAPYPRPL